MAVTAGAGFVEMRLVKAVAVAPGPDQTSFADRASFVVVLEGVSSPRRLPIAIGSAEALVLAASLDGTGFPRPMSPHFAAALLHALGGRVSQVRIDRLIPVDGGTAYGSTVELDGAPGAVAVDARPSDALNLAALVGAPVFVAPEVLADAESRLESDSAEAAALSLALAADPMHPRRA